MSAVPTFDLGAVIAAVSSWLTTALNVVAQYLPYIVMAGVGVYLVRKFGREFRRLIEGFLF